MVRLRLTFGQMYPPDEALGQVDIWLDFGSGWHFVRWLVGWPIAAGWLTGHLTTCNPYHPPGSDFWLGWHFVRWLVDWAIAVGWLVGHLTKCHLCIDVKHGHLCKIWLGSGWHFVRWLAICSWLAANLTKCQNVNLTLGRWTTQKWFYWTLPRISLWVRLTFCQMACWLANCSWLAGELTI